jgi:hypothetical protein
MKKWFKFSGILIGIIGAILFVLWWQDISADRAHTVVVNSPTPVFSGSGSESGCHGSQLTTLSPRTQLRVKRVRYLKDCATLDVDLTDGRKAYFILGVGDIDVNPPLLTISPK